MSDLSQRLTRALADRYRIERELGQGGMATVFLAEDLKHRRPVALKVLDPEVASAIGPERFLREIETVARLSHPHILALHDSGEAGGLLFYVMPYVAGESLRTRIARDRQLPLEDALRIAREVADALDHAHRHGVVHRDIKPENILLEESHARVADFGIARAMAAADNVKLTATGIAVGTPAYMSPEQAVGGSVDARADVYGLGCVLYEMLAGQAPYVGPTAESVVFQHLNAAVPRVTALRPGLPSGLDGVIAKALSKAPADRYSSTAAFVAALGEAEHTPAGRVVAKRSGLRQAMLATAMLAVVTLGLAAALGTGWIRRPWARGVGRPAWALVASFDGSLDRQTTDAARGLLCSTLDQSGVLATVSREQVREALEKSLLPETTRVDVAIARNLARRSEVPWVIGGRLERLGTKFVVSAHVLGADDGKQHAAGQEVAASEEALIPAVERLARRLCVPIGARTGQPLMPWRRFRVVTPSFEVYRLFAESVRLTEEVGDFVGATRLMRRALEIDPGFAPAWESVAGGYTRAGKTDSAAWAFRQALRRPERLSPAARLVFESDAARAEGDLDAAEAHATDAVRLYPDDPHAGDAANRVELILWATGRVEEALEWNTRDSSTAPVAQPQVRLNLRVSELLALGRLEEARQVQRTLRESAFGATADLRVSMAEGAWARAESLVAVRGASPSARVLMSLNAAVARGQLQAANAAAREQAALLAGAPAPLTPRAWTLLALLGNQPVPSPPPVLIGDTRPSSRITVAYMLAAAGDTVGARRALEQLRAMPRTTKGLHGATPEFLEAWIAYRAGRWDDVVRLISRPARTESDFGNGSDIDRIGPSHEQWLVGQAYERLGRPDSAAAYYELMLGPAPLLGCRFAGPHIHQRLALLYAGMGRMPDAERHVAALESMWTRPDGTGQRMLDEARRAVKAARGMARPETGHT